MGSCNQPLLSIFPHHQYIVQQLKAPLFLYHYLHHEICLNLSESLHTPSKQSAELKFNDSGVTDDELLAFESPYGSNNICLGEEANDQISLGQAFKLVKDESKKMIKR